jgi:hypothetical protein
VDGFEKTSFQRDCNSFGVQRHRNLQFVSRQVFLFLLAWTSVLTWSHCFWWEIHIYIGLSRRWKKHGGERTESIVHSLTPDDFRTRNKSNLPAVGWCRSIFIGYYEQEGDESTGQMLHLPSSQLSLQNPQDKGGPIVTNGAVVLERRGALGTKIHCIFFTGFLPAST